MNIIDLTNYENIFTFGVSHGKLECFESDFIFWLDENKKNCKNSIFVILGDTNLGLKEDEFYFQKLKKVNDILNKNKSIALFIRGTQDNPEVFNKRTLSMSNCMTIPDFTILKMKNKNILCIGGGISFDRSWKVFKQNLVNQFKTENKKKTLFWENESFDTSIDKIDEIISSGLEINALITHTYVRPFCENIKMLNYWTENDEKLSEDIKNENIFFSNLFESLPKLEWWVGCRGKHYNANINEKGVYLVQMTNCGYCINPFKEKQTLLEQNALLELQKESNNKKNKNKPYWTISSVDAERLRNLATTQINPVDVVEEVADEDTIDDEIENYYGIYHEPVGAAVRPHENVNTLYDNIFATRTVVGAPQNIANAERNVLDF